MRHACSMKAGGVLPDGSGMISVTSFAAGRRTAKIENGKAKANGPTSLFIKARRSRL
jgi:hypothetical protein